MTVNPFTHGRSAQEWLTEAAQMLQSAKTAQENRDQRTVLACVKAAINFGIEATLITRPKPWGASPITRLAAFGLDSEVPELVRKAAQIVERAKTGAPELTQIGGPTTGPRAWMAAATRIVEFCAQESTGRPDDEARAAHNGATN